MMNNYFHDLATALLLTSVVVTFALARSAEETGNVSVIRYFVGIYPKLTLLARASLVWIVAAGTVRLITFKDFEWVNAVGKNQVPVLIFKHIIIFGFVGTGIYLWRKLGRRIAGLKASLNEPEKTSDNLNTTVSHG